jgi:hypothetical protein
MTMNNTIRFAITALACSSLALLAGCDQNKPAAQQGASVAQLVGDTMPASSASTDPSATADPNVAPAASTYTPPTAAQLISLLAPVAVFPDKLVAQVLAASEYPDQITQANTWLAQNSTLKGDALQQAIDKQTWDPGVKAIVVFPDVLHQMASNVPWTTALGEAYVNDPNDVMNAIQALRTQAMACNKLKSDDHIVVTKVAKNTAAPTEQYAPEPPVYSGPPVIPPPEEVVQIAPAQPDYVYVPYIDPATYYGTPIDVWPGYAWAWPAPVYWGPAFAFGFGVWIGGFGHWGWGWNHWDIGWGRGFDRHWGGYGWRNASVVYNNRPYVGNSATAINHFSPASQFAGNRAGIDPAGARATAGLRAGTAAAFAGGAAAAAHANGPVDYSHLASPHFTSAMAQHGAGTPAAMHASYAVNRSAVNEVRSATTSSANFAAAAHANAVSAGAERPGALASSRYAPSSVRGGGDPAARQGGYGSGAMRESAIRSSTGYAREAYNGGGYRVQNQAQRGFASAPHYAAQGGRSFGSAPRASAPHGSGGGHANGGHSSNHRR